MVRVLVGYKSWSWKTSGRNYLFGVLKNEAAVKCFLSGDQVLMARRKRCCARTVQAVVTDCTKECDRLYIDAEYGYALVLKSEGCRGYVSKNCDAKCTLGKVSRVFNATYSLINLSLPRTFLSSAFPHAREGRGREGPQCSLNFIKCIISESISHIMYTCIHVSSR